MATVEWDASKLFKAVDNDLLPMILEQLAQQGEGQVKANINANNQIDTGFMVNSVYAVGPKSYDTYGQVERHGKKGQTPAARIKPRKDTAIVAVAAEYAIYQEAKQSFLFKMLEQLGLE